MSRIGVARAQEESWLLELGAEVARQDDARQRLVAGGDGLGERDQVGCDPERLGAEPLAGAAEPADDLVEDQQGAVLVAESTQALEVAVDRWEHAAGALYGLGDDRRDPVALVGEHLGGGLEVVVGDLDEVGDQVAPALPVGGDALGGGAAEVGAVVAVGAAYDDLALGLSAALHRLAGDLDGGVDGLRTGAAQENPAVGERGALDDHLCHAVGRLVRERVEDVVGLDPAHLVGDGVDDLGAAVAHLAVPEAAQSVYVVLAGVVVDERPRAADDVDVVGHWLCHRGEGVQQCVGHSKSLLIRSKGTPGRTGWRSGGRVSTAPIASRAAMITAVAIQTVRSSVAP